MQKFKYKIIDRQNQVKIGELESEDIQSAGSILLNQGYTVLDLRQKGLNFESLKSVNVGGVPFKEKVVFIRQLSFMINAGIPLTQAIDIAGNQVSNESFKKVIQSILKDIQSGVSFGKALDKHPKVFDPIVKNLIRAGEESGKLDVILERTADDMEKKQEFNGKVKGALIYPIVILCAIVVVVVMMLIFMIPQISSLFKDNGQELPLLTRVIVAASDFLRGLGGVFTLILMIAAVVSFFYYRKTPSGRIVTDGMMLKLPVFGILINKSQIASFCRTFSMLVGAGLPILDALKLVADSTSNAVYQNTILDTRKKVEKGIPLSQPILQSHVFPDLVGNMMRVGEETGKIDIVVEKVGIQYAKEVDQMAANLNKLMEPLILIIMGVVVGILAIAIYMPVFQLGSVMSGIK